MATLKINNPAQWSREPVAHLQKENNRFFYKMLAFADSQAQYKTFWFLVSMIAQGVFFLPVPAVLMYYFNAPILVLIVTLTLFFANIIAGMGGSGIRVLLSLFGISVLIHLIMLAMFIL